MISYLDQYMLILNEWIGHILQYIIGFLASGMAIHLAFKSYSIAKQASNGISYEKEDKRDRKIDKEEKDEDEDEDDKKYKNDY